jgi:hypothetical protein
MPQPVFSLATTGTDPKSTTKQILETEVNRCIDVLQDNIDGIAVAATLGFPAYASTAAGLAATAPGGFFSVHMSDGLYLYQEVDAAAVLLTKLATPYAVDAAALAALAAQVGAEAARDAAINGAFRTWPTTAAGVGNGVAGVASLVGGSGGTNGTFALAFSGGTQVIAPIGFFTVAGGAVVSVVITYPGYYSAGTPTLSFAASSGLTGASATAQMAANTPVNQYFTVPSTVVGEASILYRNLAGVATEILRTPSASIAALTVVDPFPVMDYAPPASLVNTANPASGLTATAAQYTIANAGRFYCNPTIASLGLAVGDTARVAFRKISGAAQPASFTFRNGVNVVVGTISFVLIGGWYIAEAVIPATTATIQIDYTNATGADVVISRPRFAKKVAQQDLPVADRWRLRSVTADPGVLGNLWINAGLTVASNGGSGSLGSVVNTGNGFVTIPADMLASIRMGFSALVRPNGNMLTVLVKVSSPLLNTGINLRFVGATTGETTVAMTHLGDGWWFYSGAITTADPVGIRTIYIEPDNRAGTPSISGYTSAAVTIGPVIVVDGASMPDKLPAPSQLTFPDGEIVLTQTSGNIQINQRAGEPEKYIQWNFERYLNAPTRSKGWRISGLQTVTRNDVTAFSAGTQIANSGEAEIAIQEVGKSDFMGGITHGDMEETRVLQLFVDGNLVTPDGTTSYRAGRVEAIQKAQLWEVDNVSPNLTADLVTRWMWSAQELRLAHRLTWRRSINILNGYLSMLDLLRAVGTKAFRSPDYTEFDMSAPGHGMTGSNSQRVITTGPAGVKVDMEITKGFTTSVQFFATGETTPARNKLYFSFCPIGGSTAVVNGDVIDWECVYRIGAS